MGAENTTLAAIGELESGRKLTQNNTHQLFAWCARELRSRTPCQMRCTLNVNILGP